LHMALVASALPFLKADDHVLISAASYGGLKAFANDWLAHLWRGDRRVSGERRQADRAIPSSVRPYPASPRITAMPSAALTPWPSGKTNNGLISASTNRDPSVKAILPKATIADASASRSAFGRPR